MEIGEDDDLPLVTPFYVPGSPPDDHSTLEFRNTKYFAPIPAACVMEYGWWCRTHVRAVEVCVAVAAEREACAKIAETTNDCCECTTAGCCKGSHCVTAAAIRARP